MTKHQSISQRSLWVALFGVFLVTIGFRLEVISAYADSMPYWDDFTIGGLLFFYESDTMGLHHLVRPANEHRIFFNRLLSLFYFEVNQHQWDPKIGMVSNSVIWAFTGLILAKIILSNLGFTRALPVLILLAVLWCVPFILVNILWGVQTHTYTMIFFIVLGCWWATESSFSRRWWFGMLALACAPLTLAGGTFAAFSVFAFACLMLLRSGLNKRELATAVVSLLAGLFGLALILMQPGTSVPSTELDKAILTFLKTLSWPLAHDVWPVFIFAAPILALFIQIMWRPDSMTRLARFTLTLYFSIFIIVLGIAYARGSGFGPPRRYFDYLLLLPFCGVLALLQLRIAKNAFAKYLSQAWGVAIFVLLMAGIPTMKYTYDFTIKDQKKVKDAHQVNVMSFMNSKQESWLLNKGFRGVPFPRGEHLVDLLTDYNELDILPYQLQTRQFIFPDHRLTEAEKADFAFALDGSVLPSIKKVGVRPFGEPINGSYLPDKGGVAATGRYLSNEFHHNRDYIAVQVLGDYGEEGLSLKFVEYGSGKEYLLKPRKVSRSIEKEQWRYILQKLPKGYYRLLAEDNSDKHWFAFATPKSVGRLSFQVERLIARAELVWLFGVFLILLSLRYYLVPQTHRAIESGVSNAG